MNERWRKARFQYRTPWTLPRWGFAWLMGGHVGRSCDEWHNPSKYVIVPLIGGFTWYTIRYPRTEGTQHVYAKIAGNVEGDVVAGCDICVEILNAFLNP